MSSRYDLFDQKWCVIHSCPAAADKHSCFWDLWAGHRPGRAECRFFRADIKVSEGDSK